MIKWYYDVDNNPDFFIELGSGYENISRINLLMLTHGRLMGISNPKLHKIEWEFGTVYILQL